MRINFSDYKKPAPPAVARVASVGRGRVREGELEHERDERSEERTQTPTHPPTRPRPPPPVGAQKHYTLS